MSAENQAALDNFDFDSLVEYSKEFSKDGILYAIREASGDAAYKYRNRVSKCFKLGADGKPLAMEELADTEPFLVSLCLFTKLDNKPVPATVIRSWPNKICKTLFAKIREVSELDDDQDLDTLEEQLTELQEKITKAKSKELRLKNDRSSTEIGSD